MLREVDEQRRKEDPTFKGAFHEKKEHPGRDRKPKAKAGSSKPKSRSASTGRPVGG